MTSSPLALTAADRPDIGRKVVRLVEDVQLPVGDLLVGDPQAATARHPIAWRIVLRLGVMERRIPQPSEPPGPPPVTTPISVGSAVGAGSILVPVFVATPCLHRAARDDVVQQAYEHFRRDRWHHVAPLRDLWLFGDDADDHLVPAPLRLDALDPVADFDRARALEEAMMKDGAGRARRRLVQRHPIGLLSSAIHLARTHAGVAGELSAADAAEAGLDAILALATRRGPIEALQVPAEDVDLLHRFPASRRGRPTARNVREFVARAARVSAVPNASTPSATEIHDWTSELSTSLKDWRKDHSRSKGRPWCIPELEGGHLLLGREAQIDLDVALAWSVRFVRSSSLLRVLDALGRRLPWCRWAPSRWWCDSGGSHVHRVVLTATSDIGRELVARLHALGAPWARDVGQTDVALWIADHRLSWLHPCPPSKDLAVTSASAAIGPFV